MNFKRKVKPGDVLKAIDVQLDCNILNKKFGVISLSKLQELNVKCGISVHAIKNSVIWTQKEETSTTTENSFILIILSWDEIAKLIQKKNLVAHVAAIKSQLSIRQTMMLGLFGLSEYFKSRKAKIKTGCSEYDHTPKITVLEMEEVLTEIQVQLNIGLRTLENGEEIVTYIFQLTKSIADIPYKLEKRLKEDQVEFCWNNDNKKSVVVDENGNGLRKLWQQQLTLFGLATLETAEAICHKYPNMNTLMKAYENCNSNVEQDKLLQDIPIRRSAGQLNSGRKIGPEVSKKISRYFNIMNCVESESQ